MDRFKKIISVLIRILYFALLAGLLLSYLAPYTNPKEYWPLAFFGLAYPYLLLLNLLFLMWWVMRWNKLYWLSLVCILCGWMNMKNLFHIGSSSAPPADNIKILSYNVRLFDLYNWTHDKGTRTNIFRFIEKESADIVCLQEFFQGDSGYFETLDTIIAITGAKGRHVEYTHTRKKKQHWGIATFSKYPVVNTGVIRFKRKSNNVCIYTDIVKNNDTIRVYNMHLQSIGFDKADYRFIEALQANNDTLDAEDIEIASKNILRRMKRAFIKRAYQTERVLEHISQSPYPVIVCGDFNDTPFSYTYHSFSEKLKDAFMESGTGIGNTYIGNFPSYRIDYIFHSADLASTGFEVLPQELSDHYPARCILYKQK